MSVAVMNALRVAGAARLYSALVAPVGAVILMYHSVAGGGDAEWIDPANRVTPAEFESHMEFLAAHRNVVAMDAVADSVHGRAELPPGSVALTFDDGYLDNLMVAAPVLARLGLPATLYLPTAYIDAGESQWIDRAYAAFRSRTLGRLALPGVLESVADLANEQSRRDAYARVCAALLGRSMHARARLLEELRTQLAAPARPERCTMNWDEIGRLRRDFPLFTLGGHTCTHRDLSACAEEDASSEIVGCLDQIEWRTGERPRHFSFPYGRASDASLHAARGAGLVSAVASGAVPRARPGCDPLRLSRIAAPASIGALAALTHPAYPDLPLTLFGRL